MSKKYKPTKNGYKEEDEETEALKETVPTKAEEKEIEKLIEKKETTQGVKLENDNNLSIPYSDLGYSVKQLANFPQAKRIACIGIEKNKEFEKKYHI